MKQFLSNESRTRWIDDLVINALAYDNCSVRQLNVRVPRIERKEIELSLNRMSRRQAAPVERFDGGYQLTRHGRMRYQRFCQVV